MLNGSLLRLGQYDDIRTSNKKTKPIAIGWELELHEDASLFLPAVRDPIFETLIGPDYLHGISCQISFDSGLENEKKHQYQVKPRLLETQFKAYFWDLFKAKRSRKKDLEKRGIQVCSSKIRRSILLPNQKLSLHHLPQLALLDAGESFLFDIDLDKQSLATIQKSIPTVEIVGCYLQHFLPFNLNIAFDEADEEARLIASSIGCWMPAKRAIKLDPWRLEVTPAVHNLVVSALEKRIIEYFTQHPEIREPKRAVREWTPENNTLREYIDFYYETFEGFWEGLRANDELEQMVVIEHKKDRGENIRSYPLPVPDNLQTAYAYQLHWAEHRLKYLGPLREEPKALYPLSPLSDPEDIGLRGEYCASVLAFNRAKEIDYIPAKNFAEQQIKRETKKALLLEAVVEWLRYLDIAEDIRATDQGKLGHELKVKSKNLLASQDLTHVGVGVSQVLPIVLLGLLSEKESTLIFEQPELHLHPKIQSLLADFFLMLTLSGRQCLIETHSEYLINRLRYRAAAAALEAPLYSKIKIYFVERKNWESHFRDVTLNEFGAISDWPEGFFDQSEKTAEDILRAAFQKRSSRPPNKT